MKKTNNNGFSLVELIIVIAIMAVLVGVLAPQFIKYVESSRQSTDIDNVTMYKSAVESYVADNGEKVTSDVTVTVSTSDGIYASVDLDDVGLAKADKTGATKLKSQGWDNVTATYSVSTYKWTVSGTTKNTKKPEKDLKVVFE